MTSWQTLTEAAWAVLTARDAGEKAALSRRARAAWRSGEITEIGDREPPVRPGRPDAPVLLAPRRMPRRRISRGTTGRIALLHAVAHIELNAIDLAWDLIARFAAHGLPRAFYDDWVAVAAEEAKHFSMVVDRLAALGAAYGDLPAHDGLWESANDTRHDLAARLAVVPMVLEARGLDVTPAMIGKLRAVEDQASADVLEVIYRDEIGHVAAGQRWFAFVCAEHGVAPPETWRALVGRYYKGQLKPPFNNEARCAAGFDPAVYVGTASG